MNLIGYVRVSTDDQRRNGVSLDQQPERLRAYCALHGHTLAELVTDEGVSASVPLERRPGGKRVLEALRKGAAQGVVVVRLDRLFRDALDGLTFFRMAERTRAAVHSVSELIDSSTAAGRLALTIQLAAAQYERELDVARAIDCNRSLREQGRVYGPVPYGCVAVGEGDERRLMRDPQTWVHRVTAVRLVERLSLRKACAELEARGIPSPTGKRRWSPNTLRDMRVHHADLASLPLLDDAAQVAAPAGALHDPEVSHA